MFFNRVTFDASGAALSGTQVNAGIWNIGQGTLAAQRVQGNGLNFQGPTGNLAFTTLNIFNNSGTGLLLTPRPWAPPSATWPTPAARSTRPPARR
ncbi:MAG: hypothetical protein WDN28_08425 [Chthoniobacter sp.]